MNAFQLNLLEQEAQTSLPTYINTPTYLYQHPYPSISTPLPIYINTPTYLPMSTCQHIPTNVNLPSSTYLPLPIPQYQYRIVADPGAGIGLV